MDRQEMGPRETVPGLRYSDDTRPGFTRRRAGRGFSYRDREGIRIADDVVLQRIRSLAVPPAWTDVWICPWPNGHLQACGRDARARKQYRYHRRWQDHRSIDKFARMLAFADVLPAIRERCDADLRRPGLPREKILAAVVRLLELTLIRVGNEEYARLHRSFGLTTLRARHARTQGASVRFRFNGKSGRMHEVGLRHRRLAGIVRRCQELPGQELFQYIDDDGDVRDIASNDVNDYLRDVSGGQFTAKDFRTWAGTVLAFRTLRAAVPTAGEREARQNVSEAVRVTADRLGNTPAVARGSYVHPAILEAYLDGSIGRVKVQAVGDEGRPSLEVTALEEAAVIRLLRRRQRAAAQGIRMPSPPRPSASAT